MFKLVHHGLRQTARRFADSVASLSLHNTDMSVLIVRYFGSFLAIAGCQANVPAVLTYGANNVLTHSKRALNSAMIVGFGGIGGIFASLVYRQKDFPKYLPGQSPLILYLGKQSLMTFACAGIWATIACQFLIWILVGLLSLYFVKKNKQVDEGTHVIEGRPGFKYAL